MAAPLFIGLTRPVAFLGLPMGCVMILAGAVVGGYIATLSVIWLFSSMIIGYAALRVLAGYDPYFFDLLYTALKRTPPPPGWFRGEGIDYDA